MRWKTLLAVTALVGAAPAASCNEAATQGRSYSYRGSLTDDRVRIEVPGTGSTEGTIWTASDAAEATTFCPGEAEFWCFRSVGFAFAVPRQLQVGSNSWAHDGVEYEVLREGVSVRLFDRAYEGLMLIRSPASATFRGRHTGAEEHYLYSPVHGIVGFALATSAEATPRAFWLEGDRGFGAALDGR